MNKFVMKITMVVEFRAYKILIVVKRGALLAEWSLAMAE